MLNEPKGAQAVYSSLKALLVTDMITVKKKRFTYVSVSFFAHFGELHFQNNIIIAWGMSETGDDINSSFGLQILNLYGYLYR